MHTMEEIILARGDIEKVYRKNLSVTLWRAVSRTDPSPNPLYPDLVERELPNGDIRPADVATYKDARSGRMFVRSEEGRGTSLNDMSGIFGHGRWEYVVIPKGTFVPNELIIVITRDHYMARKKCWHYSVSPNYDMPVETFLSALDQLAINASIRMRIAGRA